MRIALSYDWLVSRRGGERVMREFCLGLYELSIYALFFDPDVVDRAVLRHSIYVSRWNQLPGVRRYYRYLFPWFPRAVGGFEVSGHDLLLSISHSVAKGIPHDRDIPHVSYCFTPMRYIWVPEAYPSHLSGWRRLMMRLLERPLKEWDLRSNDGVDHFVTISETARERIRRFYGRDAEVIHPCIDQEVFYATGQAREDFYLAVSALVPQKSLELAVEAFNRNGKRLLIAGTGPLRRRLARQAGANIELTGWLRDHELRDLYQRARALVFPGIEEFGLVPLEAQACGCPVIAFGRGGLTETLLEGETAIFFEQPTADSLLEAVRIFESDGLSSERAIANSRRFSRAQFRARWRSFFQRIGIQFPWGRPETP